MGNAVACENLCSKNNRPGMLGELVSIKDFEIGEAIGRGGFGKVVKVTKDGRIYAMKEMLKARVMAKKSIESVMKELELMCRFNSEFIVNVQWAFHDQSMLYLVMDLMEGGDLRYHHSTIRKFPHD